METSKDILINSILRKVTMKVSIRKFDLASELQAFAA